MVRLCYGYMPLKSKCIFIIFHLSCHCSLVKNSSEIMHLCKAPILSKKDDCLCWFMYVQIFRNLEQLIFYEHTACISFINAELYEILTASSVQLSLKLLKRRGTCCLLGNSELDSQKNIILLASILALRKDVPFCYMGSLHFP